jgi:hypothetical protein
LAVSEPVGYFGNGVQRFGGIIKEKDLQTVGKRLINGGCHFLEMRFQYMKISLTTGSAQVKWKIFIEKNLHDNIFPMFWLNRLICIAFQRGGKYIYRELKEELLERNNFQPSHVRFLHDVVFVKVPVGPFNDDLTLLQDRLVCSNEELIYLGLPPFSCPPRRGTAISAAEEASQDFLQSLLDFSLKDSRID